MKFTLTVGVASHFTHVFGKQLLEGVLEYAHGRTTPAWEVVPMSPDTLNPNWQDPTLPLKLDGLILGGNNAGHPFHDMNLSIPVVDVRNTLADFDDVPSVKLDNYHIGRLAAETLHEAGYTRFWYAPVGSFHFSHERGAGFFETLARLGHRAEICRLPDKTKIPEDVQAWAAQVPAGSAIFCANDQRACRFAQGCLRAGRVPGQQIGILGVDNDPVFLMPFPSKLATVDPNFFMTGKMAARTLHDIMRGVPPVRMHQLNTTAVTLSGDSVADQQNALSAPVREILRHIHNHVRRGAPLPDFSQLLQLPPGRIRELMLQETGLTRPKTVIAEKMMFACDLLRDTRLTHEQISDRLGYSTPRYFSKCFSAFHRVPPQKYRSESRKTELPFSR